MADKIDQLKIGTASYDIDLPKDASIDIAAAVVGGTAVVTQADLTVLPNPIAELPPTGSSTVPIYITSAGNFAPVTSVYVTNVRASSVLAASNGASLGTSTSAFKIYGTDIYANNVYARVNGAALGSSSSAFRVYATTVTASSISSTTAWLDLISSDTVNSTFISSGTVTANYISSATISTNFIGGTYLYGSFISSTVHLGISSSATTATANTTRVDPRCLITTGAPASGSSGSVSRLFEVRCSITPGTSTTAPSIFSVIGPRFTSTSSATTSFADSLSVNSGIQVNGSIVVGTSTANAGYLTASDGVGIFPAATNYSYIGNASRKWYYCYVTNGIFNAISATSVVVSGTVTGTQFYATSDARLKTNISVPSITSYTSLLEAVKVREYAWKSDEEKKPNIGVIAQELRDVLPEEYKHEFIGGEETENSYLAVDDGKLVYLAIGALQEQAKDIAELKKQVKELQEKLG